MEGFVKYLDRLHLNGPTVITKENINDSLGLGATILGEAICKKDEKIVSELLLLNPSISFNHIYLCDTPELLELLLQAGANPNIKGDRYEGDYLINSSKSRQHYWFFSLLLYYGADISCIKKEKQTPRNMYYLSVVASRIIASRKALAALIIYCKRGFYPLRDVGVALAREMWAQKGRCGCGPRSKKWLSEEGRVE